MASYIRRIGVSAIQLQNPVEETLIAVARALRKRINEVIVMVLDRPRHAGLIAELRAAGAALRMVSDGDIAAAMAPSLPESGIDLYMGIGGSPEAVLAAAGIKCLGGDLQAMMWPRDNAERDQLVADGHSVRLGRVFYADDLAYGKNILFCATGISDSALLPGVEVRRGGGGDAFGAHAARSRTVRFIKTYHDFQTKTIRLRSSQREQRFLPAVERKPDEG